jgi:hypothetical protein
MPAINPNNYNIDSFNSQNLGPITVTDFRNYVLTHNLPGVDPNIASLGYTFYPRGIFSPDLWNPLPFVQDLPDLTSVSFTPSPTNNNTSPRPDNLKQNLWTRQKPFYGSPTNEQTFVTTTKSLEDPGSIDNWVEGNGFEVDVTTVRDMINLSQNEYGPSYIFDYSSVNEPYEVSGYQQYPSSAGGDVLGPIIGRTLGFSTTNFIDFPSELQTVARERRVEELENRIKLNFVEDTVGKINLDPLSLLAGGSLFTPNYTITRPKSFLGKAAEFTANLAGFNVPTSIIPGSKTTTQLGSNAFQDDLLDYTGKGQRDLLYANVYSSKYTPELLTTGFDPENEDTSKLLGKVGDFFRDLGKQSGDNYLKISQDTVEENKTFAQKVGTFINDLISPNAEKSLIPTPETDVNPPNPTVTMGLDGRYPAVEGLDDRSRFNNRDLDSPSYFIEGAEVEYYPNNTTMRPSLFDSDDPNSSFAHQRPSADALFDWRDRDRTVANRGLIKFTQDMINNAEANGHKGGAKYIGRFNSNSNIVQADKDIGGGGVTSVPKHSNVSMGNLVRDAEDDYYCRSWSTRNPYQNRYDLIRSDALYRNKFINGMSVLEEGGHVKIAPFTDGRRNAQGSGENNPWINADPEIKRHMFSIENLAWADAPEKIGLEPCELGPNGGRIMWFPPYDINFTDNTTVSWDSTVFLGRAEPIYTYNHTERKGTLSFSIITDHPSVLNQMKDKTEKEIYKFFAGCGIDITEFFEEEIEFIERTIEEQQLVEAEEEKPEEPITPEKPEPPKPKTPPEVYPCYFRNARKSEQDSNGFRVGGQYGGRDIEEELAVGYELDGNEPHSSDKGILNLNEPFRDNIEELIEFLATEEGQNWGVEFIGYTSGAAPKNYNKVLSIDRATSALKYVRDRVKEKGLESEVNVSCPSGFTLSGGICYGTSITCPSGYTLSGGTCYSGSTTASTITATTTASTITTTTISGVFNPNNFSVGRVGYVCKSGEECLKATEDTQLNVDDLQIDTVDKPNDLSTLGRFIINAQGEDSASSPNDEDAKYGNNDKDFSLAKEDRKVTLVLFPNEEYIINNQVIKLEPKKLELLPVSNSTPLEPIGLNPDPIVSFNPNPVTSKLGTDPIITFEQPKPAPSPDDAVLSAYTALFGILAGTNDPIESPIGEDAVEEEVKAENEVIESVVKKTVQKLFTECSYFERIKKEDPFIYDTIKDKIKSFHPAFHAITPEGFNSRLTFLHQCTRQGPSIQERAGQAQNMAFGRPPICILRIGDFYYTKIVIDSVNINYEPLQWDLNPEGIGVQPQIAKVDLNFSFIGGSSMEGPIRQLQNAVSFNFFANTAVYNPRRLYNSDNNKYLTLQEKLDAEAEGLELKTGGSLENYTIGYGAYKTPEAASDDIVQNGLVITANDEIDQTENTQLTDAETPDDEKLETSDTLNSLDDTTDNAQEESDNLTDLTEEGLIESNLEWWEDESYLTPGTFVLNETKTIDGSTDSVELTLGDGEWSLVVIFVSIFEEHEPDTTNTGDNGHYFTENPEEPVSFQDGVLNGRPYWGNPTLKSSYIDIPYLYPELDINLDVTTQDILNGKTIKITSFKDYLVDVIRNRDLELNQTPTPDGSLAPESNALIVKTITIPNIANPLAGPLTTPTYDLKPGKYSVIMELSVDKVIIDELGKAESDPQNPFQKTERFRFTYIQK